MTYSTIGGSPVATPSGAPISAPSGLDRVPVDAPAVAYHPLGDRPAGAYVSGTLGALPTNAIKWVVKIEVQGDDEFLLHLLDPGDFWIPLSERTDAPMVVVKIWAIDAVGRGKMMLVYSQEQPVAPVEQEPEPEPEIGDPVALAADEWALEPRQVEMLPDHPGKYGFVVRVVPGSPAYGATFMVWSNWNGDHPVPPPCVRLADDGDHQIWLLQSFNDSHTHHVRAPGETLDKIRIRYATAAVPGDYQMYRDTHDQGFLDVLGPWSVEPRKAATVPAEWGDSGTPAPAPGTPATTTSKSSITMQSGSAVSFDRAMQCGQFWDGSWFVVNPAGGSGFSITAWTPNGSSGTHGVMVNPRGGQNGFESTQQGNGAHHLSYSSTYDKAPNRNGPISFAPGEEGSVIKCISVTSEYDHFPENWRGWHTDQDRHFCLTVLKDVPPEGSFRPAAHGGVTSKAPIATIYDIDWNRIPTLNVGRLPSQDRPHLTIANCITNFLGETPRDSGNFNGQIHHLFNIRSQSQLARRNSYGGQSSYGSYWGQMAQAAMVYLFAASTPAGSKELLLKGLAQFSLEVAQTAAVETANEFHGPTFGETAMAGVCMLGNATLRNQLIGYLNANTALFDYSDKYKYITSSHVPPNQGNLPPLEGRDPGVRRKSGYNGSWPWDFPFLSAHIGMPHYLASFSKTSNADHGAKLDTWKAKQYNMERMVPFFVSLIEGGADAINQDIVLEWIDRYMYWWDGDYGSGLWDMPNSDSEEWRKFDADWRVHRAFWQVYRDYRSMVPRPVWTGKPEQPFAPILTKSGSTINVEVGRFRCGNGLPLTKLQYRVRQSSSRSSTSGWSSWTDVPGYATQAALEAAAGSPITFSISGRPSGANQVQVRLVNSAGAGPESLNIPYRADEADAPGRQPAGNLAQINI